MNKILFAESVHGAMHKEKNMPREDAAGILEGEGFQIFVTADGHGDKECIRSAKGAELAVSISIEKLSEFYHAVLENNVTDELFDSTKVENRVRKLIGSIIGNWNLAVCNDASENPFTEEELAAAVKYGNLYRKKERVSHAYGTTLMAGLLTKEYLLLIHQGDGHCIVIDSKGETIEPVPWDDNCFANIVTSICDKDALNACRYAVIQIEEDDPIACFMASDGVDDSFFSMKETYAFCHELVIKACEEGILQLQTELSAILDELSQKGSRDDTTVSGFMDVERCKPFVEVFQRNDHKMHLEGRLKQVEEKLVSMSRKKASLEERARTASEKRVDCEKRSSEKKTVMSEISEIIRQTKEGLVKRQKEFDESSKDYELLSDSVREAKEAEEKAVSERDAYLELYHQYEAEKEKLEKQISAIDSVPVHTVDEEEEENTSQAEVSNVPFAGKSEEENFQETEEDNEKNTEEDIEDSRV